MLIVKVYNTHRTCHYWYKWFPKTSEKTEGTIRNWQSRDSGHIGHRTKKKETNKQTQHRNLKRWTTPTT